MRRTATIKLGRDDAGREVTVDLRVGNFPSHIVITGPSSQVLYLYGRIAGQLVDMPHGCLFLGQDWTTQTKQTVARQLMLAKEQLLPMIFMGPPVCARAIAEGSSVSAHIAVTYGDAYTVTTDTSHFTNVSL